MLDRIEAVLSEERPEGWMSRWLEVCTQKVAPSTNRRPQPVHSPSTALERVAVPAGHTLFIERGAALSACIQVLMDGGGKSKPKVAMPPLGFGDPTSYQVIAECAAQCSATGAVRHGAECFNYLFPQDLDDELLVCWEGFMGAPDYHQVPSPSCHPFLSPLAISPSHHPSSHPSHHPRSYRQVPWQYLKRERLLPFLSARIDEGYAVPLNPKWLLCDPGWYAPFVRLQDVASSPPAHLTHPPRSSPLSFTGTRSTRAWGSSRCQ